VRAASRLAVAVGLMLVTTTRVGAHDPVIIDPLRATGSIQLELVELPRGAAAASPQYRLIVRGVPAGVTIGVWTRDFAHGFHEVASGFRADGAGHLVASADGRSRDLSELVLDPGPYFRGAIWEVAVVSADRTLSAFARAIPRPMVARDGGCTVTLQLVSHRGQRFLASSQGFVPGDDVTIESRYAGRVQQKRQRVPADGVLPADVLTHVAPGPDHSARYSVTGRSCQVTIDYEWGEQAFSRG
jgi:hypothetical protein